MSDFLGICTPQQREIEELVFSCKGYPNHDNPQDSTFTSRTDLQTIQQNVIRNAIPIQWSSEKLKSTKGADQHGSQRKSNNDSKTSHLETVQYMYNINIEEQTCTK